LNLGIGYNLPPTKSKKNIFQIHSDLKRLNNLIQYKEQQYELENAYNNNYTPNNHNYIPSKLINHQNNKWIQKNENLPESTRKPKRITPEARANINQLINETKSSIDTYITNKYNYHERVNTHLNNIRTLNQMQKDGTIIIKKADKSN
jgi:hypothetical protein